MEVEGFVSGSEMMEMSLIDDALEDSIEKWRVRVSFLIKVLRSMKT